MSGTKEQQFDVTVLVRLLDVCAREANALLRSGIRNDRLEKVSSDLRRMSTELQDSVCGDVLQFPIRRTNDVVEVDELLTPRDVAKLLSKAKSTLARYRTEGTGPPFIYVGRDVRYPHAQLREWLSQQAKCQSTAER